MPQRTKLLKALQNYQTDDRHEQSVIPKMIDFIRQNVDCFERTLLSGHITGSAWLLSPDEKKVLLTHHKKLGRWLQLGGHSDGDWDTWHVALREATEESGIPGITFINHDIFDVDIHTIPENKIKNEPAHLHYDIRFLLKAPCEDFIVSTESYALKWTDKDEFQAMLVRQELAPSVIRMFNKWFR